MGFTLAESVSIFPGNKCLQCGLALTGAAGVVERDSNAGVLAPEPGSVTVCIQCGHVMMYCDDLSLRNLNAVEQHWLLDPRILTVRRVIARRNARRFSAEEDDDGPGDVAASVAALVSPGEGTSLAEASPQPEPSPFAGGGGDDGGAGASGDFTPDSGGSTET